MAAASSSSTASTASTASARETAAGSTRSALIIDGSYAMIGARDLGGKIDYIKLRAALEEEALTKFGDCWFFDQNPSAQRLNSALTAEYYKLKLATPDGPNFQVSLFPMKKYNCHCRKCGNHFTQNVQKGVDNGIATKILSLAYENICDRFILFAGDGDFYSSLNHVRNVLRKDIWVIGYRGTVSGDLQQLASRTIWMNDLWVQVKSIRQVRSHEQGRRKGNDGLRNETRKEKEDEGEKEECNDEVRWFEDHQGEDFQLNNGSPPALGKDEEVGSGRQVFLAPSAAETSAHPGRSTRNRGRAREGRGNGKGRAKRGRGRSRSRSRDRPRAAQPNSEELAFPSAGAKPSAPVAVAKKKKGSSEGKRGAGGRNSKKRKRNDVPEPTESNERGKSKRGGSGDNRADDVPVFTLSDISSDENEPFPLALPVFRRPDAAAPMMPAALVMTVPKRDAGVEEIGSRTQVIDLASDTESE